MHSDELWQRAQRQVVGWLRRHRDPWTNSYRDDLVQEATIAAWRWAQQPHEPKRFWAALRTMTRRGRLRQLWRWHRQGTLFDTFVRERSASGTDDRCFQIDGRPVAAARAVVLLEAALGRLQPLDRQLLQGLAEGFCTADMAVRHGRSEECIRTRVYRARRRLQREIEACVRAAGSFNL